VTRRAIYDQFGSVARVIHAPRYADQETVLQTVEDCEPVVESVRALRDQQAPRSDMKHVARVPVTVVEKAMREGWFNDQKAWDRWLNDPDNKDFRVWGGRV
jgi:thioesterase domain-containing protein